MVQSSTMKKPSQPSADNALVAAFNFLSDMGLSGQFIWETGKDIKDVGQRLRYLKMAIGELKKRAAKPKDYYSIPPVDVTTFVLCKRLLNMGEDIYPAVLVEIAEMMNGQYVEAVLTGGIGTGKTTIALVAIAYTLYELSCMADPHKVFDIARSSEILFIFQSLKMDLSKSVDYKRFKAMIDNSPYFQEHFRYDKALTSQLEFPRRIIVKPLTGDPTAAIGQNVFGGVLDEVNFMAVIEGSSKSGDGGIFDQAKEVYNSIARRRQSRFMHQGEVPGMLCLVSSKRYPGEFTDVKSDEAKKQITETGKSNIFIYDKRVWEIKPDNTFSGQWFVVFVGDQSRKPRMIEDYELGDFSEDDQPLLMRIPREYKSAFDADVLDALRDVAGVSTLALHPFMVQTEKINEAFGKVRSIASRPDCDLRDNVIHIYPKLIKRIQQPRFIHLDLSKTGDHTGFAMGYVKGFTEIKRGDEVEILPEIVIEMILDVIPPRGDEIDFSRIRELIYNLRDKVKIPIKWVTMDTYQSTDMKQILGQRGFITGEQSMDITSIPYDVAKQAIYDGRLAMPIHQRCQQEFVRLERDPHTKLIDHPPKGSKDCSDAVAGVCYGLTMRREIWSRFGISLTKIPPRLTANENQYKGSLNYVETIRAGRYKDG